MKLIVGLGNPGKSYDSTRHNVGFMILDHYVDNSNWKSKFEGLYVKEDDVVFLKPQTYMNNSGFSVRKFVDFYKINPEDVLIIQDDLDLPFNTFKLKKNSSSGGHNGIKSIINCLGSDSFGRLKIGIANDKSMDTKDYVLGNFSKQNLEELNENMKLYEEIITNFIKEGIDKTITKYNSMR